MYVCVYVPAHTYVAVHTQHTCGGQRTACRGGFPPPYGLQIKLGSSESVVAPVPTEPSRQPSHAEDVWTDKSLSLSPPTLHGGCLIESNYLSVLADLSVRQSSFTCHQSVSGHCFLKYFLSAPMSFSSVLRWQEYSEITPHTLWHTQVAKVLLALEQKMYPSLFRENDAVISSSVTFLLPPLSSLASEHLTWYIF